MWTNPRPRFVHEDTKNRIMGAYYNVFRSQKQASQGLIGAGNNPMVGMTVAVAVAIEEASK